MADYLFVYGTLLPGLTPSGLSGLVDKLKRVGGGSMPGRLFDLGPYPAAVFDAAAAERVVGVVYELPSDSGVLRELDDYEGYIPARPDASLFVRELVPVTLDDGSLQHCWVYRYGRPPTAGRVIAGGDYAAWRAGRDGNETASHE